MTVTVALGEWDPDNKDTTASAQSHQRSIGLGRTPSASGGHRFLWSGLESTTCPGDDVPQARNDEGVTS